MIDQTNEYTLLSDAGAEVVLTDFELALILGGAESGTQGGDGSNPNHPTTPMGPPPPPPLTFPIGIPTSPPVYVANQQIAEAARDAADYAASTAYYGRGAIADGVEVGTHMLAGRSGSYAPVVEYLGQHVAEWIRPDGPPPVDHDEKK